MKKRFLPVVVVAVLSFATATSAFAGGKKKSTPAPVREGPVISSVSATSVTVTDDTGAKTFSISQFTEITVNGQRATVADLKPGMHATVALGTDATKASRITATGK